MSKRIPRFDLVEVVIASLLVGFVVWTIERPLPPVAASSSEIERFARKYGPQRHSEHPEEWLIRDFFGDKRGGVFVDVGANDYKTYSNTFFLDTELGWSGIAIEPQTQFEAGYLANRPRTRFRAFAASNASGGEARLFVQPSNLLVTSEDRNFNNRRGDHQTEMVARTITISDLLDAEGLRSIDFLTMDIELSEPQALEGFDIERFKPALACVESHPEVRQQILDYFADHHYTVVAKYLLADPNNLYFMPRQ